MKYGAEAFDVETIPCPEIPKEKLYLIEQRTIVELGAQAPNGYNLTDGGPGNSGATFSESHRKKIADANTGERSHRYGKVYTPEERKQLSEKCSGWKQSADARRKISDNNARHWQGKDFSDKHRTNISKAMKDIPKSAKTRRKMSKAQKGKTISADTRQKLSASTKKHYARKKHENDKARGQLLLF